MMKRSCDQDTAVNVNLPGLGGCSTRRKVVARGVATVRLGRVPKRIGAVSAAQESELSCAGDSRAHDGPEKGWAISEDEFVQ